MGTRNLTMVISGGKVRVAQYCQWDGYPTGQGGDIADFIQGPLNVLGLDNFIKKVDKLTWATVEEVKASWSLCGANPDSDMVSLDIAKVHGERFPEFNRDTGAGILKLIAEGKVTKVQDDSEFLKDSLFCEYAYKIDLDTAIVTVIAGGEKVGEYDFAEFTRKAMKDLENRLMES